MKGQDVLLLLKLIALERGGLAAARAYLCEKVFIPEEWEGWAGEQPDEPGFDYSRRSKVSVEVLQADDRYSVRGLEQATGISKSEVSAAMRRCADVGLLRPDRRTGQPRANSKALMELICFGARYVFPVKLGPTVRGIPTAAFAPVLKGKLMSPSEDSAAVWEDARGVAKGQSIEPLYRTVPFAVRGDPLLYALLALTDSIRIGNAREVALAQKLLADYMGNP